MSNRSKSLFKGPNATRFALVHRSVRDPLANDPEAGDRVLSEIPSKGKGRTKAELEQVLGDKVASVRSNEGEAATYGIYYDDSQYDYMKHLRVVGDYSEGGATLVEAPRKNDTKGKGREIPLTLKEKQQEDEVTYREFMEKAADEGGLRPDMDPSLREVLEALDDEAYIEDEEDEEGEDEEGGDFFDDLLKGKARQDDESPKDSKDELDPGSTYATQVAVFKNARTGSEDEFDSDEDDFASEGGDTIAELQAASARRPPRGATGDRKSMASASAFSMSSSSMFRNDGLRTLDDRFDQVEAMYEDESDEDDDEAPELSANVQDLMDDFLDNFEILGGKMKPVLGGAGATPAEKLESLRKELAKMKVLESVERQEKEAARKGSLGETEEILTDDFEDKYNKWDCETVLSTYSNLENHPRVLRLQNSLDKPQRKNLPSTKISIDPRTGFPIVLNQNGSRPSDTAASEDEDDASGSDTTMDASDGLKRQTIARSKDETPEQKKARKAAVKQERQDRRLQKRSTKEAFGQERKRQQKVKQGKLRDAADVSKGNTRGIEVMSLS